MPDTADHRVDMFRLARQRTAAGLPVWDRKIQLADVFHDEGLTFEQRRDAIVARLRQSPWIADRDRDGFDRLGEIVENLADAPDTREFDDWWDELYDHADVDRVWIATF
jgi:hypothetical protein